MDIQKRIIILFLIVFVKYAFGLTGDFKIQQNEISEQIILAEIITNYLIDYFSDEQIFLSMIIVPSERDQQYFHEDFFKDLFDHPTLTKFPHNILNYLDNRVRDHKSTFYMIFIDSSKSIS